MLMSPRSSAPFWSDAPDRMLPVWPGWMPTPVACLLNRPVTKFILALKGAIGSRLLPSSMSGDPLRGYPDPLAHQWSELMPQAMNRAANRFGHGTGAPPATGA